MSVDTTNISELPTDPTNGGNISLNINEKKDFSSSSIPSQSQLSNNLTLDQSTINQIVSGLQQATQNGSTQLPSRDIPLSTSNITHDPYIQPNYIPEPALNQKDYIKDFESNQEIMDNYNRREGYSNTLDDMYDEIQMPIFIAILFFIFQLPIVKRYLYNYFPILFNGDGNLNIYGFLFNSALFGLLYYTFSKVMNYYGKF